MEAFVPYLDTDEVIDSISVDGLPAALSKEIASISLEQDKAIKREIKVEDRVRVKALCKRAALYLGFRRNT